MAMPADLDRARLRGYRVAVDAVPPPPGGPNQVERPVSRDGFVMVTQQSLRIGRVPAGELVTIVVEVTRIRVVRNGEELAPPADRLLAGRQA